MSVILPTGYDTMKRLTPSRLVATPARLADPSSRTTMMAPSVGTREKPAPTNACAVARYNVLRLISGGMVTPDARAVACGVPAKVDTLT